MHAKKIAAPPPHNRAGNHKPSDETRVLVDLLTSYGIQQHIICRIFGLSTLALHKLYGEELKLGGWSARAYIARKAFQIAMDDNNPHQADMVKFFCKTMLGMSETERRENVFMNKDGSDADLRTVIILPSNGREVPAIEAAIPELVQRGRPRKDVH